MSTAAANRTSNATNTGASQRTVWTIDPAHTSIEFSAKHMMITTVKGRIAGVEGRLELDEADPTKSTVEVTMDPATLDTREPKRDDHLRSADFLDVAQFPELTFRSKRIERSGDGFKVTGDLTIRGETREIVLQAEDLGRGKDPWGGERASFEAKGKLNRSEFGLKWNQALETGGVLVSDEIKLAIDAQFVKSA